MLGGDCEGRGGGLWGRTIGEEVGSWNWKISVEFFDGLEEFKGGRRSHPDA